MTAVLGPGPWCGTADGYRKHRCRCDACHEWNRERVHAGRTNPPIGRDFRGPFSYNQTPVPSKVPPTCRRGNCGEPAAEGSEWCAECQAEQEDLRRLGQQIIDRYKVHHAEAFRR